MDNKFIVDECVILYAFRYALGRHTYSVADMTETILNNKDKLSDNSKHIIVKEINEYFQRYEGIDLIHECDKNAWKQVADALK